MRVLGVDILELIECRVGPWTAETATGDDNQRRQVDIVALATTGRPPERR
jgi:hypothetical protein